VCRQLNFLERRTSEAHGNVAQGRREFDDDDESAEILDIYHTMWHNIRTNDRSARGATIPTHRELMMKDADRARARRIFERIQSRRAVEGPYSAFGRLKPEALAPIANAIAATYPSSALDEEDLRRCVLLHLSKNPAAARTHDETTAMVNQRRVNEQKKIAVRDVSREFLGKLTPRQRLEWVNSGTLPAQYVLKGPMDE